jgi:hypothetical protein
LADPKLLDQVVSDLGAMGWIGEDRTKRLLYLVAVSRLLAHPLWAVYQSSGGAAPWHAVGCVAALTPPEARTILHRVTDAALVRADSASLRHCLLVVDQAETIRPEAALSLRILHERGGVGWPQMGAGGEARGPVAVLSAAAGEIDHRCRDCFLPVTVDESPGQTEKILAEQRNQQGMAVVSPATQAAIIARHHAAQRLLERLPVAIPFAGRIAFPSASPRHRDEQRRFLGLIAASALLHQRQRGRADGAVVATEDDFAIAVNCTAGLLGVETQGISSASQRLLAVLFEHKLTAFTMADISGLLPDWSRFAFRSALQDLADFGYVDAGPRIVGGRGHLRNYHLLATAATPRGIHLRPAGNVIHDEEASNKVAESGGNPSATLSPCRTGT